VDGSPRVTVAVPSFNQGRFLAQALDSIFAQGVPVEVYVADAGSTDDSLEVIRRYSAGLAGWRSHPDTGQAAAINESIAKGSAPYVAWLNSDDWYLPEALPKLIAALEAAPQAPFAYARVWNYDEERGRQRPNLEVHRFSERLLAQLNIVSQPATLIRRSCWEAVGGVDATLQLAMDYDLWWRLYRRFGEPAFVEERLAVNRRHRETKTTSRRRQHYTEAMDVLRRNYGRVPLKWYLAQPFAVWMRTLIGR
jgi:glycosyltransferase involved in cell wall biosynthesis